jgi:hypothetical protein
VNTFNACSSSNINGVKFGFMTRVRVGVEMLPTKRACCVSACVTLCRVCSKNRELLNETQAIGSNLRSLQLNNERVSRAW